MIRESTEPNFKEPGIFARDVLDWGFVALRNVSGPTQRPGDRFHANDVDPAQTARMSFDNFADPERTREQDLKLAEYLLKNVHTTPFEMIEFWFEMKMPIFIARQFIRHRTATVNEVSGRYVQLPAEWYIPKISEVRFKADNVKQGGTGIDITDLDQVQKANDFREALNECCQAAYNNYQAAINDGICMEQARLFLHLNHYTHWIWKQDLHNLMHLLALRLDSHAQVEAQAYAQAIYDMMKIALPETMKLFDKYRRNR